MSCRKLAAERPLNDIRHEYHYPTHFPYTTLFRSLVLDDAIDHPAQRGLDALRRRAGGEVRDGDADTLVARSEEHTSELQSRENLVCRLLLEKKNHSRILAMSIITSTSKVLRMSRE